MAADDAHTLGERAFADLKEKQGLALDAHIGFVAGRQPFAGFDITVEVAEPVCLCQRHAFLVGFAFGFYDADELAVVVAELVYTFAFCCFDVFPRVAIIDQQVSWAGGFRAFLRLRLHLLVSVVEWSGVDG